MHLMVHLLCIQIVQKMKGPQAIPCSQTKAFCLRGGISKVKEVRQEDVSCKQLPMKAGQRQGLRRLKTLKISPTGICLILESWLL